jgi:hypothetical protein
LNILTVLNNLEGDDLLNYVIEYAFEHEAIITSLRLPAQTAYFTANFEAEFYNGGIEQFLTNRAGRFALETVESFARIGARKIAGLIEASTAYDAEELFKNDEAASAMRRINYELHQCYPSNEDGNVGDQLVAYLQENRVDIINQ